MDGHDKTKVLSKGPTTQHVFNRTKQFLETEPDIDCSSCPGSVVGTDIYIKNFVTQNCLQIMLDCMDIGKHELLTDGFVNFQRLKFCQNTNTQYIHIPDSDHFLSTHHQHVDRMLSYKKTRRSYFELGPNMIKI